MVHLSGKERYAFRTLAAQSDDEEFKAVALELDAAFGTVIDRLQATGWEVTQENLKAPEVQAFIPAESILEESADRFQKCMESDPEFSSAAFQCLSDFGKCRRSGQYHIAWCATALAICLAERVVPLAGR